MIKAMKEILSRLGRRLITPPAFSDHDRTQAAGQIFSIVQVFVLAVIFLQVLQGILAPWSGWSWLVLLLAPILISLILLEITRRGHVRSAAILLVVNLWLLITIFSWTASGLGARAAWGYFIVVFIAGMLLGKWLGIATAGLCSAATLFIALTAPTRSSDPLRFWLINTLFLVIVLLLQNLASRSIRESLASAHNELRERHLAEAELRRSDERFKLLSSLTSEGIMIQEGGIVLDANQTFAKLVGHSNSDSLIGKNGLETISFTAESQQRVIAHMRHGFNEIYEVEIVKPDGSILPAETQGKEISYQGRPARLVSMRDISERKRAEEKLHESERRYRTLFESAGDAIFLLHGNLIIDCNSKTQEMFGCARDQIIGSPISRFHPPRQPDGSDSLVKGKEKNEAAQNGNPQFFEWRHVRFDGTSFDAEVSLIRVELDSGMHLLAIVRDITAHNLLEEQLRQAQKMEAVGILAGGVAHDFNNILSSIVGYASLLQMLPGLDSKVKEYLERILASTERAASLTHSLLAFSRKQAIELQPVDVNEAISGFHKVLTRLIGEDIDFRLELAGETLMVDADIRQIEQVLMNLATNSRDAMPNGGRLTIATRSEVVRDERSDAPQGVYAVISVSDTGTGINSETRSHLFEPFFTTKEVGKGTGLGLAIVYGIIKNHHGFIKIESEAERSTAFHIYLPLNPLAVRKSKRKRQPKIPRGDETILLVEDDAAVRHATRSVLEEFGYTVLEAADGVEAMAVFEKHRDRIDLLICDLIMPKINGQETRAGILKIKPDVRTLFISGYTNDIIARKGIEDPGVYLLLKPLHPAKLLEMVRQILDA
jgi:two-component system cell cycle sensor histidine kinase/response regulator CckA